MTGHMARSPARHKHHPDNVFNRDRRVRIEFDLNLARRRAAEYLPFSPAWDAAVAQVEDLEREASELRRPMLFTFDPRHLAARSIATLSAPTDR